MRKIKTTLLILLSFTSIYSQNNFQLNYENGNAKVKGELVEGKKNGLWEAYDSENNLIIKREYKNNVLVKNYLDHVESDHNSLKEEDVLWSKRIERILNPFKAKNKPLYERQYLKLILVKSIKNKKLISYNSLKLDSILTQENALKKIAEMDISKAHFKLKEDWFFNKKTSTMEVVIIGLSISEPNKEEVTFYFPEVTKKIGEEEIFVNEKKTTIENYFHFRLFESEIINETRLMEKKMTPKRAKEIDKLLIDIEIQHWFKNN